MSSTTSVLLDIVNDLRSSKVSAEEAKGAEKARVGHLQEKAKRLFESGFEKYTAFVRNKNGSSAISQDHAEVHVLAAEAAFATDHVEISRSILDNFFKTAPQKDSVYCRAKLTRALVIDAETGFLHGDASLTRRQQALKEIMETLDVAMDPSNGSRYNFVVYNASVVMWRVVHQFIRSTRGRHITAELQRMSSALETTNDPDKEWRIMYISATAAALEDADQKKLACDTLDKALDLAESCLEAAVAVEKTFLDQMAVCKKETDELMMARRAQEIYDEIVNRPPKLDPDAPDGFAPRPTAPAPLEGLAALSPQELKARLDASQARLADAKEKLKIESDKVSAHNDVLVRLYLQRINVFPSDTKRVSGSTRVAQSLRTRILTQLQSIRSGAILEKDWATTMQQIYTQLDSTLKALDPSKPPDAAPVAVAPPVKGGKAGAAPAPVADPASQVESLSVGGSATNIVEETLLDLSRFAWTLDMRDLAIQCNERADMSKSMAASIRVKSDFCKAIKIVADLATVSVNEETGQRLTSQQVEGYRISKRIEALKLLERILGICASRLKDANLLHEICVAVWNTALPLLQSHLRHNVHGPFHAAAQALEDIASPMTQLRVQLHYELCKCEEQNDFVVKAKVQAEKALHIDYGAVMGANTSNAPSLDKTRNLDVALKPVAEALELRSSVYDAPDEVESLVLLSVHQVSESRSRNFQEESLYRSIVAMLSVTKTGAKVDENSVLGNGVPQMVISKVKSFLCIPSLDALTDALSRFGEVAALSVTPPATEKPAKNAAPTVAPVPSIKYAVFDALTQKRCLVMFDILKAAAQLGASCFPIVQNAAAYLLQFQWDPEDPIVRKSLLNQVETCFLLSESLVARLSLCDLTPELAEMYAVALDGLSGKNESETVENPADVGGTDNAEASTTPAPEKLIEPMCLGVVSKYATEEMQVLKQLVVRSLLEAMKVAGRVKDDVLCQNAFIYFWNQHVHILRRDLSKFCLPILLDFLKAAHSTLVAPVFATPASATTAAASGVLKGIKSVFQPKSQDIDFRLRVSICEAYASVLNASGTDGALAQEIAIKGCSTAVCESPYARQRLCELACRLVLNPPSVSTSAPAAGGKGGAKGATTAAKASDSPKFDHPFLNTIALLVFAEDPSLSKEQIVTFANRIRTIIDGDLKAHVEGVNVAKLTKEEFEQLLELRAEVLTRLTRVYVMAGDVYGAYKAAEQCTKLIEEVIKPESHDASKQRPKDMENSAALNSAYGRMSPRVWRWVSLCERYFGAAVSMLIKPTGQDKSLQNDLYLASLRHYALSCQFGRFASIDKLVVESATDAWNICMPLIDVSSPETIRSSLHQLIWIILQALEGCSASMYDEATPEHALGDASDSLKQRYFLAIIEGLVSNGDWEGAMKVIINAFEMVPQKYQRSIWKLRVVVMSKRGKNALDGIQKLKEGDPSLQAKVYGVLARAAALPQQQLEAYVKAIDSLSSDVSRVEYILEMAQWLASSGMPKVDIYELLLGAVDALAPYLIDASQGEDDEDDADAEKDNASSIPGSVKSKSVRSIAKSAKSLASVAALKTAGRRYIASSAKSASVRETDPTALPVDPNKKTLVHCDYAFRALSMIALIEPQSTLRTQKALEAVFFVESSLQLWNEAMKITYKRNKFMSIPLNERQAMDFRQYTVTEYPPLLSVPLNSLDLMLWAPSEDFEKIWLAARSHDETSMDVPSPETHASLVLSVHYLKSTSDLLLYSGFPTSALLCIAWTRAILMMQTPQYSGVTVSSAELEKSLDSIHVELYYRALFILKACGLEKCGARLSKTLGRTGRDIPSFFASIAESGIKSSQSSTVVKVPVEKPRNETMNPYGFHTYTDTLGRFDVNAVLLSVCSYLCKFGSENAARSLLNSILPAFQALNDYKSLLRATLLLASLEIASGRWTNALALLSSLMGSMGVVGDPVDLAEQTCLAMVAYCKLDMLFEAKQLASAALAAMDASIAIPINKTSQSASPSLEMTSKISQGTSRTAPATASTQAPSVTSNGNTSNDPRTGSVVSAGPPSQVMELSFEGACAYARVCSALVLALCDEAMGQMKNGTYPLDLLAQVSHVCDQCLLRIAGVETDVSRSSLYATILSVKAQALFKLSLSAYTYVPSKQQNVLEYKNGVLRTLRSCAQMQSEVCEIRRQVACLVPVEEESFSGSSVLVSPIFANKPSDAASSITPAAAAPPPAAKGKEVKGTPAVAPPTAEPNTITEGVSNTVLRQYGLELVAYSNMLAVCSAVDGCDAAKRMKRSGAGGIVVNRELSVIEKFLQDSAPVSEPTDKDFQPSDRVGAVFSASSSIEFLRSSMFELTGKIAHLSNALYQIATDSTVFDCVWQELEGTDTDSLASTPKPYEVVSVLQDLSAALVSAIRDRNFSAMGVAPLSLVDCYGKQDAARAANWLILSQSVSARQWLWDAWTDALPGNSDVRSAAVKITSNAESKLFAVPQTIDYVNHSFLMETSVAYRRLQISTSVGSIVGSLAAGTHVLCMSYSAADGVIYCCAGVAAAAKVSPEDFDSALPGTWIVEKMTLLPEQQRDLQSFRLQHKAWCDDVVKFIATYNDQMTAFTDIANQENSAKCSGSFMKAEKTICDRHTSIFAGIGSIFEPLLGKSSLVAKFLHSNFGSVPNPSLLLLLDPSIQDFPLEVLDICTPYEGRIFRDFSIHMLGHRLAKPMGTVGASLVSCIVDPYADDVKPSVASALILPMSTLFECFTKPGTGLTAPGADRWRPVCVKGGCGVTLQDWTEASAPLIAPSDANKGRMFYIHCPAKLSCNLTPGELSLLNLSGVSVAFILDGGHSDTSYRRQNGIDNKKTPSELAMEDPIKMLALMSLNGANSVVGGLWSTSFASQYLISTSFWTSFATEKQPLLVAHSKSALACAAVMASPPSTASPVSSAPLPSASPAAASAVNAGALTGSVVGPPEAVVAGPLKPWLRLSRVFFGVPTTTYDAVA